MGRRRRYPIKDGRIVSEAKIGQDPGQIRPSEINEAVERSLGYTGKVCHNCRHTNPQGRDTCRKCGRSNFRPRASDYRGEGSSGANI